MTTTGWPCHRTPDPEAAIRGNYGYPPVPVEGVRPGARRLLEVSDSAGGVLSGEPESSRPCPRSASAGRAITEERRRWARRLRGHPDRAAGSDPGAAENPDRTTRSPTSHSPGGSVVVRARDLRALIAAQGGHRQGRRHGGRRRQNGRTRRSRRPSSGAAQAAGGDVGHANQNRRPCGACYAIAAWAEPLPCGGSAYRCDQHPQHDDPDEGRIPKRNR